MALRALAQGLCARQSSWLRVAPSAASGARGFASDEQVVGHLAVALTRFSSQALYDVSATGLNRLGSLTSA